MAGLAAAGTLSLAGCFNGEETPQLSREELENEYDAVVETTDRDNFDAESVTIDAGGTVAWFNNGERGHTVTAYEKQIPEDAEYFDSGDHSSESAARNDNVDGVLDTGDTYTYTFEVPGTYEYFCIPHEISDMKGTVIVE
jgi:plastocyanin